MTPKYFWNSCHKDEGAWDKLSQEQQEHITGVFDKYFDIAFMSGARHARIKILDSIEKLEFHTGEQAWYAKDRIIYSVTRLSLRRPDTPKP